MSPYLKLTDYTFVNHLILHNILSAVKDGDVLLKLCSLKLHAIEHAYVVVWHPDICIRLLDFFRCLTRHPVRLLSQSLRPVWGLAEAAEW